MIDNYKTVIEQYDFFMCSGKTSLDIMAFGKPVILLEGDHLGPAVTSDNVQFLSDMNFALTNPLVEATRLHDFRINDAFKKELLRISINDNVATNTILVNLNSIGAVAEHLVDIYLSILDKSTRDEKI
jgi:hypothetical protein